MEDDAVSLANDSWSFEGLLCHLQRSTDPRLDLGPADPGRPTHKFLQNSKNYDILIWCHIPRKQNSQNICHHNTNLDYHSSEHPPHYRDECGFAASLPAAHNGIWRLT